MLQSDGWRWIFISPEVTNSSIYTDVYTSDSDTSDAKREGLNLQRLLWVIFFLVSFGIFTIDPLGSFWLFFLLLSIWSCILSLVSHYQSLLLVPLDILYVSFLPH